MVAVYAVAVLHGSIHLPANLAVTAFGITNQDATVGGTLMVGIALAGTTFVFRSVIGAAIRAHVEKQERVLWQSKAEAANPSTDNILSLRQQA
ncbi:MAG: hypothetical protein R2839_03550 [Thermomicrobiales bacterium]